MWELDCEESWVLSNWCFWTVVLEKTLENPLDCKEIQPVHSKGDQSWVFIGRTDAEGEIPILWPCDAKRWLIGKDPDAGRDWGQEEKGTTEDEMVGWHHRLDGRESEWTPGVGDGQGGLTCCSSWGRKESDRTERLNWTVFPVHRNKKYCWMHTWQNEWIRLLLRFLPPIFYWLLPPCRQSLSLSIDGSLLSVHSNYSWSLTHPLIPCASSHHHHPSFSQPSLSFQLAGENKLCM